MRLYITRPSPYARKAWAAALDLGLENSVEIVALEPRTPAVSKPDLDPINPLGKVPALITDEGELIADSPVIVAYIDALAGDRLLPSGPERWRALTLEALADGCTDAGVVLRLESLKDEARQDPNEIAAYTAKINRTLDVIERDPNWLSGDFNVGALALACSLDWLVFRKLVPDPLGARPRLAQWLSAVSKRPSLAATRP